MNENKVEVHGVKEDGSTVFLGYAESTPPAIRRKEIVANYFEWPSDDDEDYSEANSCLWALEEYHKWLAEQGWTGPALKITPPNAKEESKQ